MTNKSFGGSIYGDKFEIISLIGEGGAGTVYAAKQLDLNRTVALKILKVHPSENSEDYARFVQESKILAELRHDNIVSVYGAGLDESSGQVYLAMELLSGKTLRARLNESTNLDLDFTLKIMLQISDALSYAHKKGIVHRDIKPENVFLEIPGDNAKILDFGLAKILNKAERTVQKLTQTGILIGTVNYMSPEQCSGKLADERSDIYSLACVMYECITGAIPFKADNPIGVLYKHINEQPQKLVESKSNQKIPISLERIIFKALEKKPADRFETMAELNRALTCFKEGNHDELNSLITANSTTSKPKTILLIGIIVFGLMTLLAFAYNKNQAPKLTTKNKPSERIAHTRIKFTPLDRAESYSLEAEKCLKENQDDRAEEFANKGFAALAVSGSSFESGSRKAKIFRRLAQIVLSLKLKDQTKFENTIELFSMTNLNGVNKLDMASCNEYRAALAEKCGDYKYAWMCYHQAALDYADAGQPARSWVPFNKAKLALAKCNETDQGREVEIELCKAYISSYQADIGKTRALLKTVSNKARTTLAPGEYNRLNVLVEISSIWSRLGEYKLAEDCLKECYQYGKSNSFKESVTFGIVNTNYPLTIAIKLLAIYEKAGQLSEANSLLKDLHSYLKESKGEIEPTKVLIDKATAWMNLSRTKKDTGAALNMESATQTSSKK